jgi:hypothetical protein
VNYDKVESATGSPNSVYIIFIVIEGTCDFIGSTSALDLRYFFAVIAIIFGVLFIVHPRHIRRSDGTAIAVFQARRTFKEEAIDYLKLTKDWKIWALYIIGLSSERELTETKPSNWLKKALTISPVCLSFQSTMSAHVYNLRTRSLVSMCFWMIQIPATILLKPIFDADLPRRTRAYMGATFLLIITIAVWATEIAWLKGSDGISVNEEPLNLDWTGSASRVGPLFAGYVLNGCIYACWQSVVQYVIATLSNDPKVSLKVRFTSERSSDFPPPVRQICARYAGLFKSAVSAGMTVSFGVTAAEVSQEWLSGSSNQADCRLSG